MGGGGGAGWVTGASGPKRKVERQVKVLIQNLAIFFPMSQQAVSAHIIPNSAVGIFSPKNRRNKDINS